MITRFRFLSRMMYFIGLILFGLSIGTFGYMFIEGWNFLDSLYMSVITTTTVGFGEIHELSQVGRIFTMFLIFFSFGTFAYALSSLTRYVIGGEYRKNLIEYRINKRMLKMENHVIVCGYGRVGRQVADDLLSLNIPVLVIESNLGVVDRSTSSSDIIFLEGDASQDETLVRANINKARAVVTCLPKDADNVYVVLASKEIRKDIVVIARASTTHSISKLKVAGSTHVIMPDVIGGSHMASLVSSPDVIEFLENIKAQGKQGINIESISFSELPEKFRNKTIGELEGNRLTGVTIIGYKSPEGEYLINPDWDTLVVPNSKLFVLGSPKQISEFIKLFQLHHLH